MLTILVKATIVVMKHHGQKQVGEERVYLAYTSISLFIIEGSPDGNSDRAGTWRQDLMQRPFEDNSAGIQAGK